MQQARSQDFSWGGGGVRFKNEDYTYKLVGGSGSMLPRENFRNFEMPWTTFYAFSLWRKRERESRVATRFFFYKNNFIEQGGSNLAKN